MTKTPKKRSFSSVDEIMRTFVPKLWAERGAESLDPRAAGELLAEQVLETFRSEFRKRRRRG